MADRDIISSFESARAQAIRRIRRDARDGTGRVIAYQAIDGAALALTGDLEAPYVKVINSASQPVQVAVVSGGGGGGGGGGGEVEGNLASGDLDGTSKPVKIGGRTVFSINGITPSVGTGIRTDAAYDVHGRQIVVLGGGNRWSRFNSPLGASATSFSISTKACLLGRLELTLAAAVDMYALVYDGLTLVSRFFVPGSAAAGTAVRDFTLEGGLLMGAGGCTVYLSTVANAITPPAVGGFLHAIYQDV